MTVKVSCCSSFCRSNWFSAAEYHAA